MNPWAYAFSSGGGDLDQAMEVLGCTALLDELNLWEWVLKFSRLVLLPV